MLPWLEPEHRRLTAALAAGRLGHALIVHGPAGWGQGVLASALALAIIGRAADAQDAATLAHPDLRWLAPEGPGGQIKIDDVRRLGHFIMQTPQLGPRKVAVIVDAEAINLQAANALLKTLEEPPPGSHLLLVTAALSDLLPTIRSRCQLVSVQPAPAETVMAWLAAQRPGGRGPSEEALAFELGHAPMRLLDLLDAEEEPLDTALALVLQGGDPGAVLERWARADADLLLERWMRYLADALKARRTGRAARLPQLAVAGDEALHRFWRALMWARLLVRSTSNPNRRMLLESLLLQWRDLHHAAAV
jgi:DNA polymerase III subunit delta'